MLRNFQILNYLRCHILFHLLKIQGKDKDFDECLLISIRERCNQQRNMESINKHSLPFMPTN